MAGEAFQRGDIAAGESSRPGTRRHGASRGLAPDDTAVAYPRASGLLPYARALRRVDRGEADRLTRSPSAISNVLQAQRAPWDKLSEHGAARCGRAGRRLADVGETAKADVFLDRTTRELAGTAYAKNVGQRRPIRQRARHSPAWAAPEMRLTGILPIALAVMMALPAAAQTSTVQAGVYADFRQLLSGEAPASTVGVTMTLRFPDVRKDSHPAVVIAHTIGGYQEANEGWHAEAFRKQGFATVTYPSMAVRRLVDGGAATAAWPSAVAEAYAAFRLLAKHPNIDADRIAIVGFSFGGEVAYLTAFERLRAAFLPGKARFAAHVAFYPAGSTAASPSKAASPARRS